jgi:hypothetical protein
VGGHELLHLPPGRRRDGLDAADGERVAARLPLERGDLDVVGAAGRRRERERLGPARRDVDGRDHLLVRAEDRHDDVERVLRGLAEDELPRWEVDRVQAEAVGVELRLVRVPYGEGGDLLGLHGACGHDARRAGEQER